MYDIIKYKAGSSEDHVHVLINDRTIFDVDVKQWLEECIGTYGEEWGWSYRWIEVSPDNPPNGHGSKRCQVSVVFVDPRQAFLFTIRWGDRCIEAETVASE